MTEQSTPAWEPPEQVAGPGPGLTFAPHGPRLVAYIVDVLIVAAIVTVVTLLLAIPLAAMVGTGPSGTLSAGEVWFVVLIIVCGRWS